MIAVLEDMQRLQLLQLDLSVITAAESVLRASVSAVTFVSTYDRTTDNYISATSSLKSTDYHKQASKQAMLILTPANIDVSVKRLGGFCINKNKMVISREDRMLVKV